jgi:hypothetical protein
VSEHRQGALGGSDVEAVCVDVDVTTDLAGLGAQAPLQMRMSSGHEIEQVCNRRLLTVELDGECAASAGDVSEY